MTTTQLTMGPNGLLFCGTSDQLGQDRVCKWDLDIVTWHISSPPNSTGLAGEQVTKAFSESLDSWASVSGFRHRYSSNPRTANIVSTWADLGGPFGVLGQSELPCGGQGQVRQQYDFGERWVISQNTPQGKIDFWRVAFHENGHAIGIPHISQGNAMQPSYSDQYRGPQRGDTIEALARYPGQGLPPGSNPNPNPRPNPNPSQDREIIALLQRGNDFVVRLLGKEINLK